ncbi:hypothetical protein ACFO5R_19025 [Halosolutus amylolyticus]|uniref:Uncharacterized protein n=1 Tax=Halosolutus amylolyticus TaxID=2932267 RepID=A0ABD5PTS8_9EURY|nr:hypothetical protein [Halosolutus amylolyticus]
MGEDEIETPDDITGVNHARTMLGIDREASDDAIDAAFERIAADTGGERYWAGVKAREIARLDSVPDGTVVYTVLRSDPAPADLEALTDATDLLSCAPPPADRRSRNSYERGLRRTLETARDRLDALASTDGYDVSKPNVRSLEVAFHALRQEDLAAGKRWVLGPDDGSGSRTRGDDRNRNRESQRDGDARPRPEDDLVRGWKYSVTSDGATEYYVSPDGETFLRISTSDAPDGPETGCTVVRRESGDVVETHTGRYGELQRLIKRWILEDGSGR